MPSGSNSLVIVDYKLEWPSRFTEIAGAINARLGTQALRIDHIGSTAVPGLAAKDVIDIQITVEDLRIADSWPEELLPGLLRASGIGADHVPALGSSDPADWRKTFWSRPKELHIHVRESGRPNQRYAILFRDFLRANPAVAASYATMKRALATACNGDASVYYAVKDPACDVIIAAAEQWAESVGWSLPPIDA